MFEYKYRVIMFVDKKGGYGVIRRKFPFFWRTEILTKYKTFHLVKILPEPLRFERIIDAEEDAICRKEETLNKKLALKFIELELP